MAFQSITINTPYDTPYAGNQYDHDFNTFSIHQLSIKRNGLKKFPTSQVLVLAYLDEERNLKRICIEIAGFTKLLSDGK